MSKPIDTEAAAPPYQEEAKNAKVASVEAPDAVQSITAPGVARIDAMYNSITRLDRIFIFLSVFLIAYVYGLDGSIRYTYQSFATGEFKHAALLSTINVVRSVIGAAAQPTAAKIADVFGRFELVCLSILFYVVGTIIEASAQGMTAFCAGAVLYQIGYTMIILLIEVIIADVTSTRARLFFSYTPALPFLINTWISGNVATAVLKVTTWRWGVGMFALIYPVSALPLLGSLWNISRRAKKQGRLDNYRSPFQLLGYKAFIVQLFWHLDVIGVILIIAIFGLILTPLTLAGGAPPLTSAVYSKWKEGYILAPLIIGLFCIPAFVFWELRAPHPVVPFSLLRDRGVWAPIGMALCLNFAFALQFDYLYNMLRVAFDFDNTTAIRVMSQYSFVSVIVGTILGAVVYKIRRLKPFIVVGTFLYMVAFGILIYYRGSASSSHRAGIIGGQVVLGVAGGLYAYTTQASLQVGVKHEHVAAVTGVFLATYNIGSALGNTVSGAILTQVLPQKLEHSLRNVNSTLAGPAYSSPLTAVVGVYPIGTPERTAVIDAFQSVQRLICITAICSTLPLIAFGLLTRERKLNDKQNLVKDEKSDAESESR